MTWTKLSDDFSDDCWTLSDAAYRLHVEGLNWSNRKLLDLRIPLDQVQRFAKHPEALQELLETEWWEVDGDDVVIRHHAVYQRSKDAVLKQQDANKANGGKGGRPLGPPREIARKPRRAETHSLSESPSERDRTAFTETGPSLEQGNSDESESLTHSLSESPSERDRTAFTETGPSLEQGNSDESESLTHLQSESLTDSVSWDVVEIPRPTDLDLEQQYAHEGLVPF
jgi:hypothetical protein